jgi:2-dehydropantoate 2-reductase
MSTFAASDGVRPHLVNVAVWFGLCRNAVEPLLTVNE